MAVISLGPKGFARGADELRGDLRDDGVSKGVQLSQTGGKPINQQVCSGFKSPPLGQNPEVHKTAWLNAMKEL